MKDRLKKEKNHAFGKDIYLLGTDKDKIKYWLEAPKWNCGWYWGFGYVETYTNNNNPHLAKDINSHSHISGLVGPQEKYDYEKQCFVKGDYIHNIFDNKQWTNTTFTENEGWTLSELFKSFYLLQEMAAFYGKGGTHITSNPLQKVLKNEAETKRINEELIPAVTAKIIKILTP